MMDDQAIAAMLSLGVILGSVWFGSWLGQPTVIPANELKVEQLLNFEEKLRRLEKRRAYEATKNKPAGCGCSADGDLLLEKATD